MLPAADRESQTPNQQPASQKARGMWRNIPALAFCDYVILPTRRSVAEKSKETITVGETSALQTACRIIHVRPGIDLVYR